MPDAHPPPLDDGDLAATWDAAWSLLGRPAHSGLKTELMAAWSEPHRHHHHHHHHHHHDQRHLRKCLALWARWRGLCEQPGEVAIALWFHDAIHDPQDSSNELNSAAWAARSLTHAGADSNAAQRVHELAMATQHGVPTALGSSPDARLLVDIELPILGSPAERFERYDHDMRQEHAWVPGFRVREGRAKVLQGFLDQPRLHHREAATALLESQARGNLAAALTAKLRRLAQ